MKNGWLFSFFTSRSLYFFFARERTSRWTWEQRRFLRLVKRFIRPHPHETRLLIYSWGCFPRPSSVMRRQKEIHWWIDVDLRRPNWMIRLGSVFLVNEDHFMQSSGPLTCCSNFPRRLAKMNYRRMLEMSCEESSACFPFFLMAPLEVCGDKRREGFVGGKMSDVRAVMRDPSPNVSRQYCIHNVRLSEDLGDVSVPQKQTE